MKKFKNSWLFAVIEINLIVLLIIVLRSFYDNFPGSLWQHSLAKDFHDFWWEIIIIETPIFIIMNGVAVIEKLVEHKHKDK